MSEKTTVSVDLVATAPIKAAVNLSKRLSLEEIENIPVERQNILEILYKIDQFESRLLPVEQGLIPVIHAKKAEINKRLNQLGSPHKFSKYTLFNLEPLTWRDSRGFPRLAVFSLESPNFEFTVSSENSNYYKFIAKTSPKLPQEMMACYTDVFDKLVEHGRKNITNRSFN